VLSQSGTPDEQRQAPKVLKLLRAGRHTMLVVLLLGEQSLHTYASPKHMNTPLMLQFTPGNTLVNTSLPVFLDSIVRGVA
jgi:metal transporter CNNM